MPAVEHGPVASGDRRLHPGYDLGQRQGFGILSDEPLQASGTPLLVGYLTVTPEFQRQEARAALAESLPAALVPLLAVVDDLPTRTSGKVDRDALPWPLPGAGGDAPQP